jgi:hypothetical protein
VLFGVPDMSSNWQDDLLKLALITTEPSISVDPGIRRTEVTEVIKKGPSALQAATRRFEMIKNQYHIISVREVARADDDPDDIVSYYYNSSNLRSYIGCNSANAVDAKVQPLVDANLTNILMPATHDMLALRQPGQAAFDIILNAITESRKG